MNRPSRRLIQVGSGAILGLAAAGLVALPSSRSETPRVLGADVPLVDSDGRDTSLGAFQGGWTLLFFGFTHCPDICPVTLQRLSAGLEELAARGSLPTPPITVVMVSVDPTRDSPEVLAEYLTPFGPNFVGLTGLPSDVARLASAYDVIVQGVESGRAIAHTARIQVLDPLGRFVGELPPWPGAQDMADALADATGATAS